MGSTYVGINVRGGDQSAIADVLRGREALVSTAIRSYVLVCDEMSDSSLDGDYGQIGRLLSEKFKGPCLVVANFHDSILAYRLYINGTLADEYITKENGFEVAYSSMPVESLGESKGGDAALLCRTFGVTEKEVQVEAILRTPHAERYLWETARHVDLFECLGLPPFGGCGFHYLYYNAEFPSGMTGDNFIYTGAIAPEWKQT